MATSVTDSERTYSTKGLRADLRFGLLFASVLAMYALIAFVLAALANFAAVFGHGDPVMPWSVLGFLVVAVLSAYYLGAVSASLLAFGVRPLRRGGFGSALVGFIGGFCGMGAIGVMWKLFPAQFEYLSRHPSPTPTPMSTAFFVFMAFLGGVMGIAVGLNLYRKRGAARGDA